MSRMLLSIKPEYVKKILSGQKTYEFRKFHCHADIDTIKERFRERMHGNLPAPVVQMLEKNTVCAIKLLSIAISWLTI